MDGVPDRTKTINVAVSPTLSSPASASSVCAGSLLVCDEGAKNVFFSFLSNIEEYDSDTMIRLKSKGNIEIYRIALPLFLFQALHLILDGVQGLTPFV